MSYDITQGDIIAWAEQYDGPLFHALLCDPPYHLTSITERFGKSGAAPAQFGRDGAFARASRGFMGKDWDGGDIAFRPETWATLGRVLHPGAFGMAFASTRGFHRMAVAIEDAGFIIHPVIMAWAFGSGFPKATRLDTQIDRAAGAAPVVVGQRKQAGAKFKLTEQLIDNGGFNRTDRDDYDVTEPATDLARAWAGHRYGLQALKPALEPILVFQKPYQGRPVECITRTGAGALNIEAARIGSEVLPAQSAGQARLGTFERHDMVTDERAGRWPANLALAHHPACNGHCVEACPVRRLGEQSGESTSIQGIARGNANFRGGERHDIDRDPGFGDTGTAARFFYNADWMAERLEAADALVYEAKASTGEREAGLERFTPTTVDDGRAKSIDNAYLRGETQRRNIHPTVKPISLARHLATLLLPPAEYAERRLFLPFAGVASEMIGAMLAGWEHVQGVELDAQHIEIARARLAYWQQRRWELMNPASDITVKAAPDAPDGQLTLF